MSTVAKVLLVLAGLGVLFVGSCTVLIAIGAKGAADAVSENASNERRTAEAGREAATTVDLESLLSDYKDNELRADQSFKGKFIRTTGQVGDVKKDILDKPYVTIGTGEAFQIPQLQCYLDKEAAASATTLSKGSRVTVVGRIDGLMMNVLMRDCGLI